MLPTRQGQTRLSRHQSPRPYHGYPEDQGCFVHAPENYSPNPKIIRAPEGCAEHVSNWSPNAEPWYEWEYHRFRSAIFCTRKVCD